MRTSVTTPNPCPPNVARPGYLTPKQTSVYTGLSVDYLERLRRTGEGPTPIKIGHRTVRYQVDDIDQWMQQHAVEEVAS